MRKASCGITPEGIPSIGLSTLATLVFALLDCGFFALIFLFLTLFCCHFFRDPERVIPAKSAIAVSPADGKIIKVTEMPDPFTGEKRLCISIFMNVLSVHVNRSPVAGTIKSIAYHEGKYFNASFDKAARDNERCAYALVDTEGKSWSMVQIAGLIARRIVCRVDEGDTLARGERYGMIKFGSRLDMYIPEEYSSSVHVGQKVFSGQTILAAKKAE